MKIKQHLESKSNGPLAKQLRASKARNLADAPVYVSSIVLNQTNRKKKAFGCLKKAI